VGGAEPQEGGKPVLSASERKGGNPGAWLRSFLQHHPSSNPDLRAPTETTTPPTPQKRVRRFSWPSTQPSAKGAKNEDPKAERLQRWIALNPADSDRCGRVAIFSDTSVSDSINVDEPEDKSSAIQWDALTDSSRRDSSRRDDSKREEDADDRPSDRWSPTVLKEIPPTGHEDGYEGRNERLARWERLTDTNNSRNGNYNGPRRDPTTGLVDPNTFDDPAMSVRTEVLPDSSLHTTLVLGSKMSATLSSWRMEDGNTETMAVVSQIDESGAYEVVYRRVAIQLAGEGRLDSSESGNPHVLVDLFEQTAASCNKTAATLFRQLSGVHDAEIVLRHSFPEDHPAASSNFGSVNFDSDNMFADNRRLRGSEVELAT